MQKTLEIALTFSSSEMLEVNPLSSQLLQS